jgi:hypothetical protein
LDKSDIDKIWTTYINKGYPVYFSKKVSGSHGHIETGFPAHIGKQMWNKRIFNDETSSNPNILDDSDERLMIGAGGTVGYKSYAKYQKSFTNEAKVFLALSYLSKEYE